MVPGRNQPEKGMNMIRKTITTALTVAVLGASAMMATTVSSEAGFHGGKGHHNKHHNRHRHLGHGYGHDFGYGYCYWKKIKVWDYYGFHWEKVRICG
jgi:hypothetical protein